MPGLTSRIAALAGAGAGLLTVGGAALWLSADSGPAEASRPSIAAPGSAVADEAAPLLDREGKRFARADRDDDGRITQAEYLTTRRRNFDKLDKNGDGRLGFEEYAASGLAKFGKADADGNGALAPAEFATAAPKPKLRQTASFEKCACPPAQTAEILEGDATD